MNECLCGCGASGPHLYRIGHNPGSHWKPGPPPLQRMFEKMEINEKGCWVYTGCLSKQAKRTALESEAVLCSALTWNPQSSRPASA